MPRPKPSSTRHLDNYARACLVTGLDEEIALLRLVIFSLAASCLPAAGAPPDLAACHALEAPVCASPTSSETSASSPSALPTPPTPLTSS